MQAATKTANETTPPESESSIIKRHERLIGYVARPFSRRVDIEDLMQEGRIALLSALRTFRPEAGVRLWTYARKFVLGAMFSAASRALVDDEEMNRAMQADEQERLMDQRSPDEQLEIAECLEIISSEMITLSEEERRILRMRFVEDLDIRSIANKIELPTMSAYDVYRGAIAKLRDRVEARV